MLHVTQSIINSFNIRWKLDGIRSLLSLNENFHIQIHNQGRTSASSKLYNRELSSTNDRYKNGKNAFIYLEQSPAGALSYYIEGIMSTCLLVDSACILWAIMHFGQMPPCSKMSLQGVDRLTTLSWTFHLWWKRCPPTLNCSNKCFLGIGKGSINLVPLRCGGLLISSFGAELDFGRDG